MVEFLDLPIDILPLILAFVVKSSHLASAVRVSKTWNPFATPRLYERVSIYSWHRDAKGKVLQLFFTLGTYPHLAKHVRRLEIRDFPKAVLNSQGSIPELVVQGLKNCRNLRSCTWTRDGSLSSEILGALSCTPKLRELEFNGHSQGQYDPRMLCQFRTLFKISVIMPSSVVVSQLRSMFVVSGHNLRHLTIICKSSPVVNDTVLEGVAPSLINLEQFHITGCPKVTERGVLTIVSSTQAGLQSLGLESVSPKFDMAAFSCRCTDTHALTALRSVTLTISQSLTNLEIWTKSVLHLLSHSSLEQFHIYATTSSSGAPDSRDPASGSSMATISTFWSDLIEAHGGQLRRFSVLRMPISPVSIDEICSRCTKLEELFIVADPRSLDILPKSFYRAKNLKTIHINYPLTMRPVDSDDNSDDGGNDEPEESSPVLSPTEALSFVKQCGPSITQFGCNNKVWEVGRSTRIEEDQSVTLDVTLLPYESPDIPEQFLVVRT